MNVLTAHIGHRCVLLDERRLKCHDCSHTLMLPSTVATTSTSRSPIAGPGDPRCEQHPTEHATSCRACAADAKADEHRAITHQPTADVAARAAEARAALPSRRPDTGLHPKAHDPERLAQARAELAARAPIPLPEPDRSTP